MWDNTILLRNIANLLFFSSVSAALMGSAYYLVHLPGIFPLHSVRLSVAPQRVDPANFLMVAKREARGNFITVDIDQLRLALEKLPWVRSVNIRREFPGRLRVQLEEHQVLARWNNSALVNMQGEVFSGDCKQVLPSFIGQSGDAVELAQHYAQFGNQLAALNLQITRLALSPRHAWQLHLSNGLVLELGREEMQQRLARFVAVYPYSLAQQSGSIRYVDMRYRNGFAVGGMSRS